jgi:hypothetical protein
MNEHLEHTGEKRTGETYGEKIEKLTAAYYGGEDVFAQIKEVYEAAFSVWFNRLSFGVPEVGDGLVDIIRTLEMMLPEDHIPRGRIRFSSGEKTS